MTKDASRLTPSVERGPPVSLIVGRRPAGEGRRGGSGHEEGGAV